VAAAGFVMSHPKMAKLANGDLEEDLSRRKRVLITGATGLLGRECGMAYRNNGWTVCALGRSRGGEDVVKCDIMDDEQIRGIVTEFAPTVVVHCAAERRPDRLEKDEDYAYALNAEVPRRLAQICSELGSWMIYLSTNYVFDGTATPYDEAGIPNPLSVYGKSKYAGEEAVSKVSPTFALVRVPLLYGPIESLGETSVTALLEGIRKNPNSTLDHWQERFPTLTTDTAQVLEAMSTAYLTSPACPEKFGGVFHWQANERHTKYTMALAIAEIAGIDGSNFVANETAPPPGGAPRPQFERMLCPRLEAILESPAKYRSDFRSSLEKCLQPHL
jgi:S-adenosylmethionine synthetase